MEDVSSTTIGVGQGDLGALLGGVSKFVENHNAIEANTNGRDKVSAVAMSGPSTSCSEFHSVRIASMLLSRSDFETELDFRTAHSKVHWSELSHPEGASRSEDASVDHRLYFEKLQKDVHWGPFCSNVTNVVLGRKLGGGAQGDIYEAQVTFAWGAGPLFHEGSKFVVKLMKGDCALEDLQRQWPHGLGFCTKNPPILLRLHGALVKEPSTERCKFGFVMPRFWGDLQSLIDLRMERKNAKGPPFSLHQVHQLMYLIALDMSELHGRGITHRDLKAANVLVSHSKEGDIVSSNHPNVTIPYVADWECSVGVMGTGWWRAPEILLQLKNGTRSSKLKFDEKVDVYSFAMTCYEIATGFTPVEGLSNCHGLCDAIINGARPKLPHDLNLQTRTVITSCWDPNPSLRPSFPDLKKIINPFRFV